jgi:CRP-like cAMP-binding protein
MKQVYPPLLGSLGLSKHKNSLSPVALAALKIIQTTKLCPEGTELFLERQLPAGIYILHAGRVKLFVTGKHGRQVVLGTALPGDILGLSAVISGGHYEETAVASIPIKIGFIKSNDFLNFIDHHAEAAFWVVQLLSERVTIALEQISCIEHAPPRMIRQQAATRLPDPPD